LATGDTARDEFVGRVLAACARDPRVAAVVDYGSTSEARADEWSDVDLALFIRDESLAEFERDWRSWAAQFGRLLLAYVGGVGHPWTVYDAAPVPLRADFAFHPESNAEVLLTWPNAPVSATAMVRYDATAGRVTALAARLVGQSLAPADAARAVEQTAGDFWYYCLRTYAKLRRGQLWAARYDFNFIVVGNLLALLRLEAGATERMRATSAAVGIEAALAPARRAALAALVPDATRAGLVEAFRAAIRLGRDVCATLSATHARPWPAELAARVAALYDDPTLS
jgi:lincosamide nucleotidyltransferase